jgi:hypothetical protein
MFKLLRLAIYALVGYAAYQFVMDVIETSQQGGEGRRGGGGAGGGARAGAGRSGGQRTSGARRGGGKSESTEDADGASTSHRVGRGVV